MLDLELWDASLLALGEINAACGRRGRRGGKTMVGLLAAWMDGGSLGVERRGRERGRASEVTPSPLRRSSSFRM